MDVIAKLNLLLNVIVNNMNHIDYVIEQSVLDKLNKLAYQAVNDSEGFRKLMLVAIIDDLI